MFVDPGVCYLDLCNQNLDKADLCKDKGMVRLRNWHMSHRRKAIVGNKVAGTGLFEDKSEQKSYQSGN